MSKGASLALAALIVIVCLGIGIAAIGGGSNSNNSSDSGDSTNTHLGECKYTLQEVDSYKISSFTYNPDAGKKFIRVTGTLENVNYNNTLSNNPFNFKLRCDGIEYTYEHREGDTVSITKGYSAPIDFIFQVPISGSSMELVWNGYPSDVNMVKQ